ncbi:MAG TPA: hypothetical protein VJI33_03715 [Candidatus Paceibacterota bacterium]
MDKIYKFIASLSAKDREMIIGVVTKIRSGETGSLDIKKLQGFPDLFRIRVGKYRIICRFNKEYGFVIVEVKLRNDTTYNF